MDNVITGIDIGSDSIKIVTANYIGKSFNILASTISFIFSPTQHFLNFLSYLFSLIPNVLYYLLSLKIQML